MELKTCSKCGRSFADSTGKMNFCSRCVPDVEDEFKVVRDYLYDNPGATVKEVSEATGVSETIILKLLRDERIELTDDSAGILKCQSCGIDIKMGKYCDNCKHNLAKDLHGAKEDLDRAKRLEDANRIKFHSADAHKPKK